MLSLSMLQVGSVLNGTMDFGAEAQRAPVNRPIKADAPEIAQDVVSKFVQGDRAAFEQIFQHFAPISLGLCARQGLDRSAAEDVVQKTFLRLFQARADFDASRAFKPWFFTILWNTLREEFRQRKRRKEDIFDQAEPEAPVGPDRDDQAALDRAIKRLDPTSRELILLHYVEGLTYREVAEVLGGSENAIKIRASRAHAALKAILAETGGDW